MRATVKDVAARAGVSPKTVSNVVNGVVFVRPETRERVQAAVDELQYVPNLSARGLRNGRTGAIALALPDLDTAYAAELLNWFVELAHEQDWTIQLEQTGDEGHQRERELVSRGRKHLVDGLILNPTTLEASAIVGEDSLPPVVVIGEVEQTLVDHVFIDSVGAAREMTEYLIGLGHRRIGVVGATSEDFDTATSRARMTGYWQALAAAGIERDRRLEVVVESWRPECAAERITEALDAGVTFDALFCYTDSIAMGVISALWQRGIRVPDDISVAGFDDVSPGRFAAPPLTTISFDKRAYAAAALELLADRIADRSLAPRAVAIPHRLVVRESTRAAGGAGGAAGAGAGLGEGPNS